MQGVTRYVAGILGYFVILYVVNSLLPSGAFFSALNRFLRLAYVMMVVPFLISRLPGERQQVSGKAKSSD